MWRKILLFAVLAFAVLAVDVRETQAVRISPQNPYRSFNISGINYASVRWEQQQRRPVTRHYQSRRFFRR